MFLCIVFCAGERKKRYTKEEEYRSAEGYDRRLRKSCYLKHMASRTQKLIEAFRQSPDLENIYVGQLVMWAALPAGGLPCGLLLILGILSGEFVMHVALYALLVLLYLGLLLLIAISLARLAPALAPFVGLSASDWACVAGYSIAD